MRDEPIDSGCARNKVRGKSFIGKRLERRLDSALQMKAKGIILIGPKGILVTVKER